MNPSSFAVLLGLPPDAFVATRSKPETDLPQLDCRKQTDKGGPLAYFAPDGYGTSEVSILANCWKSHLRSRKEVEEFDEENFHTDLDPEQITSRDQTVARVQLALAKLPVGQRQAITLVDLEGFSYAEVAGILEIPKGTVMSRLCRARQALKDLLLGSEIPADKPAHLVRVK